MRIARCLAQERPQGKKGLTTSVITMRLSTRQFLGLLLGLATAGASLATAPRRNHGMAAR